MSAALQIRPLRYRRIPEDGGDRLVYGYSIYITAGGTWMIAKRAGQWVLLIDACQTSDQERMHIAAVDAGLYYVKFATRTAAINALEAFLEAEGIQ